MTQRWLKSMKTSAFLITHGHGHDFDMTIIVSSLGIFPENSDNTQRYNFAIRNFFELIGIGVNFTPLNDVYELNILR